MFANALRQCRTVLPAISHARTPAFNLQTLLRSYSVEAPKNAVIRPPSNVLLLLNLKDSSLEDVQARVKPFNPTNVEFRPRRADYLMYADFPDHATAGKALRAAKTESSLEITDIKQIPSVRHKDNCTLMVLARSRKAVKAFFRQFKLQGFRHHKARESIAVVKFADVPAAVGAQEQLSDASGDIRVVFGKSTD